jgi:hypothetical protein
MGLKGHMPTMDGDDLCTTLLVVGHSGSGDLEHDRTTQANKTNKLPSSIFCITNTSLNL